MSTIRIDSSMTPRLLGSITVFKPERWISLITSIWTLLAKIADAVSAALTSPLSDTTTHTSRWLDELFVLASGCPCTRGNRWCHGSRTPALERALTDFGAEQSFGYAEVCDDLFSAAVERGLSKGSEVISVSDGGNGLRDRLRAVFPDFGIYLIFLIFGAICMKRRGSFPWMMRN